jgi:hypothetical protein
MLTTHPSPKRGSSQAMLILGRLLATPNEWVSVWELHEVSGALAVHSRISDLRKLGYPIDHKNVHPKGKTTIHSFYRINTDAAVSPLPGEKVAPTASS